MPRARPLVILALGCVLTAGSHAQPASSVVIRHAAVVDVATGRILRDHAVLVRGDRIERVGADAAVSAGLTAAVRQIDAKGRYLLPGLWDMHVHALWDPIVTTTVLPLLITQGVTGIRDMGGTLDVLHLARAGVAEGRMPSPRLVAAGPMLDGPEPVDPSISIAVGTEGAAVAAVARLANAHVDFVKVYTLLPAPAFRAVIAEAARHGLPVSGHVPADVSPVAAANAGMHSIEHMRAELGGYCTRATEAACEPAIAAFRTHGTWQVPTLGVRRARAYLDDPAWATDVRLADEPRKLRETWLAARRARVRQKGEAGFRTMRREFDDERWLAGHLHRRGVRLLAGSDAGADFSFHGYGLHDELAQLVQAGLSPLEALRAATVDAAAFLGRPGLTGQVRAGAEADLVLVDDDPLVSVANARRIHAVMTRGRWLPRSDLDRILAGARAAAR
jgi:imidazolonepropionase-like amidohydrolase